MPTIKAPIFGWGGLNTRAKSTGLPMMECTVLQDLRVVGMDLVQRKGIVHIGQLTGNFSAMDFVAASSMSLESVADSRVWGLGLNWTVEVCVEPDLTTGTPGLFNAGHTTPSMEVYIDSGDWIFKVWDTGNTPTTVTVGAAAASKQTIQITRDGASIVTRLNNAAGGTGTMSATLSVRAPVGDLRLARDDASNYYDGTIDYLRVLSYTKADHNDRLVRLPNPRSSYVLADYDFKKTGTLVYDRSRYENTLIALNTPTETATLCHNPAPVRALSLGVDENNRKQLLRVAGGKYYLATVG